jgi:hypothetical protein
VFRRSGSPLALPGVGSARGVPPERIASRLARGGVGAGCSAGAGRLSPCPGWGRRGVFRRSGSPLALPGVGSARGVPPERIASRLARGGVGVGCSAGADRLSPCPGADRPWPCSPRRAGCGWCLGRGLDSTAVKSMLLVHRCGRCRARSAGSSLSAAAFAPAPELRAAQEPRVFTAEV